MDKSVDLLVPEGKECIFGVVGDSQCESLLGDGVKAAVVVFGGATL